MSESNITQSNSSSLNKNPEWISATDKIPEPSLCQDVLVYTNLGNYYIAQLIKKRKNGQWIDTWSAIGFEKSMKNYDEEVTHWMVIHPPKDEEIKRGKK